MLLTLATCLFLLQSAWAIAYFVAWQSISQFFLLNLFISIILGKAQGYPPAPAAPSAGVPAAVPGDGSGGLHAQTQTWLFAIARLLYRLLHVSAALAYRFGLCLAQFFLNWR